MNGKKDGTASTVLIDGGYVEFQAAVLRQLPRNITPDVIQGWLQNQGALKCLLEEALTPGPKTSHNDDLVPRNLKIVKDVEPQLTSVEDISKLELVELLKQEEEWINGEELVDRAEELNASLGWKDLKFLFEHPDQIPEDFRSYYLIFTGTLWRDGNGYRRIAYLFWVDGSWLVLFFWLGSDFNSDGRLLRLGEEAL